MSNYFFTYPDWFGRELGRWRCKGFTEGIHPDIAIVFDAGPFQHGDVLRPLVQDPSPHMWGDGENALVILGFPLVPQLAFVPHVHGPVWKEKEFNNLELQFQNERSVLNLSTFNYLKLAFHKAFEKETAWDVVDVKTTVSMRYLENATSRSR